MTAFVSMAELRAIEGFGSPRRRPLSRVSSRPASGTSSPSLSPASLGAHSNESATPSAMDEDDPSLPATPPDMSDSPLHSRAEQEKHERHENRQTESQQLFLSTSKPDRPKLMLSDEEKAKFASQIEDSKKKFVSDTAYLPKSTNMGLSDIDAAALLSVNPFNFGQRGPQTWEEDDVHVDRSAARAALRPSKVVFHNAFPCLYVSNMANSISFYQKVIGFSPVGKPASHQAVLRRGPAARPVRGNRPYSAIPSAADEEGVRIILRYLPPEWGELKGDGSGPPQLLIVVSNADELFKDIIAKQQQFKPNGTEYFPEVFLGKAKVLSKPQNKPWGTRELHVLDPDGNKIIFYHELEH